MPGDDHRTTAMPDASLYTQKPGDAEKDEFRDASEVPSWRFDARTLVAWLEGRDARNCPATLKGSTATTMARS